MRKKLPTIEKPLRWVGSSKRDLMSMPKTVVRHIGSVLGVAQYGGNHPDAKAWKGLGTGVFEVVSDFDTNAYRAAYLVRFEKAIYVLHCLQKRSPNGIRTAKVDVDLIAQRLKSAACDYEVEIRCERRAALRSRSAAVTCSRTWACPTPWSWIQRCDWRWRSTSGSLPVA